MQERHKEDEKKIELLFVEDDADFGKAMTLWLSKRGCSVTTNGSAEEGIETLKQRDFDVVVSDIKLPGMDGVTFLSKACEIRPDLPFILLTGYASLESAKEAVRLQAYDYLVKPLDNIEQLLKPVTKAAEKYRLLKENRSLTEELKVKLEDIERSKKELAASKNYLDNIINSMNDSLFVTDAKGTIQIVNKTGLDLLGCTNGELIGKPVNVIFANKIDCDKHIAELMKRGHISNKKVGLKTVCGTEIPSILNCSLVKETDGNVTAIVGIARDDRERRRLEQQLTQTTKLAAIGELASGLAHEVKNPLGIIIQGINYLEKIDNGGNNGEMSRIYKMIKDAVERSDKIVKGLLDFSKPTHLELRPTSLQDVIEKSLDLVQKQIHLHEIKITKNYSPDPALLMADSNQMQQVLINLLLNAFQAMENKGSLIITTKVEECGDLNFEDDSSFSFDDNDPVLVCEIEDNGAGIPKEILGRVFDPFFSTKPPGKGVGLGLSVTKTIIESHGGFITLKSKAGKGTKVIIVLPINRG